MSTTLTEQDVLRGLADADHHKGGIKCLKLFKMEPAFFEQLKSELLDIVDKNKPSEVAYKNHVTNWTRPFGQAIQFSLLNGSGKYNDTSVDHNVTIKGKKFHYPEQYPAVDQFIKSFHHAYNMRLNGMGPSGGLSPHEEHIVLPRKGREYVCRARFHLPFVTNPKTEMLLDEELFHFEVGNIYFFNNGCVHSAANKGQDFRFHLVWDMLLTQETYDLMFSEKKLDSPIMSRILGAERGVKPVRKIEVKKYAIQDGDGSREAYSKLRMKKFGISHQRFHSFYINWKYIKQCKIGKLMLDQER